KGGELGRQRLRFADGRVARGHRRDVGRQLREGVEEGRDARVERAAGQADDRLDGLEPVEQRGIVLFAAVLAGDASLDVHVTQRANLDDLDAAPRLTRLERVALGLGNDTTRVARRVD